MDTRWARTWKPDDSKPSGRRAKLRLINNGFTDPDLLEIELHSPTLTRDSLCAVMDTNCSLAMYSRHLMRPDQAERTTLRPNAA